VSVEWQGALGPAFPMIRPIVQIRKMIAPRCSNQKRSRSPSVLSHCFVNFQSSNVEHPRIAPSAGRLKASALRMDLTRARIFE